MLTVYILTMIKNWNEPGDNSRRSYFWRLSPDFNLLHNGKRAVWWTPIHTLITTVIGLST